MKPCRDGRAPLLTGREKQILDLLAMNMTSKEAASHLGIHSRTVDNHCVNIIRKMGVSDRFEAVRLWVRAQEQARARVQVQTSELENALSRFATRMTPGSPRPE